MGMYIPLFTLRISRVAYWQSCLLAESLIPKSINRITFPDDVSTIILFFPADLDETLTDTIYPKDIETLYRQIRAHTPIKLDIDACLRLRDVDRTMDIQDKYLFVWAAGRLRNHYGEHGVTVHLDPWPKITMIER